MVGGVHDGATRKSRSDYGSSRGPGRAIALRFAQQGADLVINYARDVKAAADVQAQASAAGAKAIAVQADVSTSDGVEPLFRTALDTFGRLDVVAANAGIETVNIPVTDITEEDFDLLLRVEMNQFAGEQGHRRGHRES
ncbi:enoyl-ACP reductase-like protein [Nocardia pseudobrasiliensis]|uniref:Enoyl-ACP reductase-like protein n=2 Tax=Nocardia pseudobrasiliensis TaxID=45979 RepID=A0A370ICC0_9NOCA|nr:enoyl-ACP reductase-like protein [Nocardia pseudobrasiliensis]